MFNFKKIVKKNVWLMTAGVLLFIFLLSVFVICQGESAGDEEISFFEAFRMGLVYFLGEYGDKPQTPVGKAISLILFIFGVLVGALVIGKVTSILVSFRLEDKMPKDSDGHIIICNWNEGGDRIVKEIHSPQAFPEIEIIVIADKEVNEKALRHSPEYEKVYFIHSDPTLHEVLTRARVNHADKVIILADPDCSDPDARTTLIALAISHLEKDMAQKPYIVAEVINHRKIKHLADAGVDEWVCSQDYGLGIIAQSALYGKLSEVYHQLLSYSKDTNEIYLVDENKYPRAFLGKAFTELSRIINDCRDSDNPAILIGIKRNDLIILNPRQKEFDVLKQGDNLLVVAFNQPELMSLA